MKTHKLRRSIAAAGALLTALALSLGATTTAMADDSEAQPFPTSSTVVITKLAQTDTLGSAATGKVITSLDGYTKIAGVEFTAYPITVTGTVGTNAWQQNLAAVTLSTAQNEVADNSYVGVPITFAKTAEGTGVTTKVLNVGLYLVRETSTPAGVTPAADFLLAVPMTDPTDLDKWLDTIYVYPKNAEITAEKTVENATDYVVGDTVTWTINTQIPRNANSAYGGSNVTEQFVAPDAFEIVDVLDNAELNTTVNKVNVTVPNGLTKDTDYKVTIISDSPAAGKSKVTIEFTSTGLDKLAAAINGASPNDTLTVTIDTTVLKSAEIDNTATVYSNAAEVSSKEGLQTSAVYSKYGSYTIQKDSTDDSVAGSGLAGAEFRVYTTLSDAKAANNNYLKPSASVNSNYSDGTWTTPSNGELTISGLRYSDFADGVSQTKYVNSSGNTCENFNDGGTGCAPNDKYQTYYLVEVKALAGHQLLSEPIAFTVTAQTGGANADDTIINSANTNGFTLPLTGGNGTIALTIGGIVILGIVAAVVVVRRRREEAIA